MIQQKQVLAGIGMIALAASARGAAQAWTPSPPSNLKVFAPTTTVRDLLPHMRAYTRSLGVRCQHCHVYKGENPDDLSTFDFASDEKPAKATTRLMMKMVKVINDDLLKDVGGPAAPGDPKVTCFTCHRENKLPLRARPE